MSYKLKFITTEEDTGDEYPDDVGHLYQINIDFGLGVFIDFEFDTIGPSMNKKIDNFIRDFGKKDTKLVFTNNNGEASITYSNQEKIIRLVSSVYNGPYGKMDVILPIENCLNDIGFEIQKLKSLRK